MVETTDFCQALQPSNQVEFGVYGHIGNNFGYKLLEPFVTISAAKETVAATNIRSKQDKQKIVEALKAKHCIYNKGRSNTDSEEDVVERNANVGEILNYRIYRTSEYDNFVQLAVAGAGSQERATINNHDVAPLDCIYTKKL